MVVHFARSTDSLRKSKKVVDFLFRKMLISSFTLKCIDDFKELEVCSYLRVKAHTLSNVPNLFLKLSQIIVSFSFSYLILNKLMQAIRRVERNMKIKKLTLASCILHYYSLYHPYILAALVELFINTP